MKRSGTLICRTFHKQDQAQRQSWTIDDVLLSFLFILAKYMLIWDSRSQLLSHHQNIVNLPANIIFRGSIDPGSEATILMSTAFVILFENENQLVGCVHGHANRTFQASMSTPIPEPMRIIQLVSVLLSMRYSKMTSCTKTFVTICTVKKLWCVHSSGEHETYRSALVRSMDVKKNYVRKHIPDGHPSKLIPFSPMRDI
jgi:hypothetical protein